MLSPESAPPPPGAVPPAFEEAERLFQAARELDAHHDAGRHIEALKLFLAFVEAHRRELSGRAEELARRLDEAAMSLHQLSVPDLAGRAVEVGLGFSPNAPTLLHHKALILLSQNRNLSFVVPLLDRALSFSPHDKAIWATKGDALQLNGQREAAIEAYLHAQQLEPGSMQYVDRALKLDPKHAGALRVKLDLSRAHRADRRALEACEALLEESPSDPDLMLTKADILVAVGELETATAVIAKLRESRPKDVRTSAVYARLLFALGRMDEAVTECRRLLESKASVDPTVLAELAERAERGGFDRGLALEIRNRLRETDPRNVANLQALRALAVDLQRLDLAVDASNALLDVSPNNLEAMRVLAELLLSTGKAEAAFREYQHIAESHPHEVGELRKAMVAAQSAGRAPLVRDFSEAVLREVPEDLAAREALASSLAQLGERAGSLDAYSILLKSKPTEVRYLLEKKRLLTELDSKTDLPAVFDELFRLDPTRTDVALERGNLYLAEAYARSEGSIERATAARTALVSYERASLAPERRSSALLGLARAARVVHMPDRAIQAYTEFLALPGNDRRGDAHKELGHILREANRLHDAEAEYSHAIQLGLDDADLLWGEVEVLTQQNEESSALRYLDLLLLKEPKNTLFLRRKGQLLLKVGRRPEALEVLRSAVEAAQGDPHIHFDIAAALRNQGAYADAIAYYERALEADPKSRSGRLAYAEALLQAGRLDEVVPEVDRLLHEDPNDLGAWKVRADAYRALQRTPELVYSLKAILLLDPHNGPALQEKARLHHAAGQKEEAFESYRELLAAGTAESADPRSWLQYAEIAGEIGNVEEATKAYDRAASIEPGLLGEIATRRARLRLHAGRPDLALEMLDSLKLPEGGSAPPATQLLRAEILAALERPADAQAVYESLHKIEPTNREALGGLARMLIEQGKPAEARTLLRAGISQVPADPQIYLLLAEAEGALGSIPEALGVLEQAVKALPDAVPLWTRLAEVYIRTEEWPKASDALAHAMALDPFNADLPLRAGFVAEKIGHQHEALALYEHATRIAPTNKYAWSSQGLALLALGRPDEAVPAFDRALGLDSDFEAAKDGKKAALQKTREGHVERFGRDALLLEAKLGRPVTRNDLFVTLHVPYDLLEPVLTALARTPRIDIDRLTEEEMHDLEAASCQLVSSALDHRPAGIERRGLTLADVAVLAPPNYTLAQLQRLFGYVRSVLQLELRAENLTLTPDVEELARRALVLPEEQRTLFQIVRSMRVGLFKARIIKTVESAGAAVHAPLPSVDLSAFAPEFQHPPAAPAGPATAPLAAPAESGAEPAPTEEDFFPAEEGTEASPGPEIASPPTALEEAPSSARCVGCGGIASVLHSCGVALCQHCIAQFHTCPKCGQAVELASARAIHPGSGPAPAARRPSHSSPLRSLLGRAKSSLPVRRAAQQPVEPAPHAAARSPGGHAPPLSEAPPRGTEAAKPTLPKGRSSPAPEPPAEPPPPPPPPRVREKRDDEPRL